MRSLASTSHDSAESPALAHSARTATRAPAMQRYWGNRAALRVSRTSTRIQPKLQVGAVNDPLEAEADRVADQVMRMPDAGASSAEDHCGAVRRKCDCEESGEPCASCAEEKGKLMRRAAGDAVSAEAPPEVNDVLRSPGQPLDASTRAFFEPRFGRDLGQVRVNTGSSAAESARAVGAHAYTVGKNIVFGEGKWQPASDWGRRLLAHELAHVVQQSDVPGRASVDRMPLQRQEDPVLTPASSPASSPAAAPAASPTEMPGQTPATPAADSSQVKDTTNLKSAPDMDVADGRAFALSAIEVMRPYGAKISQPSSDAIASTGSDTSGAVASSGPAPAQGVVQTYRIGNLLQRSGGSRVKPEAGFVGSVQICYNACNGELSVVGWVWAGGGVVTRGLMGGESWWGAYVFAEKELLRTTLGFMPTLKCGQCRSDCKPEDGATEWGGGISGFPIAIKPGERSSLRQAGIEVGVLLTPHVTRCDADLEVIALVDLTKYLGPIGAAVTAGEELANKLGKKFGIEIECGVGVDVSGNIHLCRSVPGGGILGITSDSASICGGGYVGCGVGLAHDKSALPGI